MASKKVVKAKARAKIKAQAKAAPPISSGWKLFTSSLELIWQNRRLFFGVTLTYGIFNLVFVHGMGRLVSLSGISKSTNLSEGYNRFNAVLSSTGSASTDSASLYQSILLVITVLAIIWLLRQLQAKSLKKKSKKSDELNVRKVFYHSTYALVPFILELLLISIQLLPMLIGASIYSMVISNGLAVGPIENLLWLGLFVVLSIWSIYMVTASIFGLFVVTLPEMTPMQAWRSARKLVAGRRWTIMRKLLFLPFIMLLIVAVLILPVAIWLAPIAEWLYFLVGVVALPICVVYLYSLYREIL